MSEDAPKTPVKAAEEPKKALAKVPENGTAKKAPAAAKKAPAAAAVKRPGPGRPPSRPPPPLLEKKGIVSSPKDPRHRLEFVYGDPTIFKSLFTYFKNLKSQQIHLRCTPRGLTFFTRGHDKKSRVVAHVAGEHVNWHYCEEEYWMALGRESVEKIFASIDKTFYKITFIQLHEEPGNLLIVLKDADIEKECNYNIVLPVCVPDEELYAAEKLLDPAELQNNFPVEFTLSAKQFKKTFSDVSNYSDVVTFEKIGSRPLQVTYDKQNLRYNEVYRDSEKIKLRSSIADGENFRAQVVVANIKSLASSMVTDDVRILCREKDDLLFRSAIDDKALVVSTLAEVR
jgi:hypothetical protein